MVQLNPIAVLSEPSSRHLNYNTSRAHVSSFILHEILPVNCKKTARKAPSLCARVGNKLGLACFYTLNVTTPPLHDPALSTCWSLYVAMGGGVSSNIIDISTEHRQYSTSLVLNITHSQSFLSLTRQSRQMTWWCPLENLLMIVCGCLKAVQRGQSRYLSCIWTPILMTTSALYVIFL